MPVGETYLNGQHWHDSSFFIPNGSARAVVTVYYQLTSRPFIEFLAANGGERGAVAIAQWEIEGTKVHRVGPGDSLWVLSTRRLKALSALAMTNGAPNRR